jgi:CheY-like chemotaxis protein
MAKETRKRVVVADDAPPVRRFVASVLADYPELEVEYLDAYAEALLSLRRRPAHLLILDVSLAKKAELDAFLQDPADRPRAVLVASRAPAKSSRLDGNGDYVLSKPFSRVALARIVSDLL